MISSGTAAGIRGSETGGPPGLLRRGARVGRYVVEAPLGAGGIGVVYAARDPELDRRVALRMVPPDLADRPSLRARVLWEAQTMARLSHPNVGAVYDVVALDGHLYIATEIVDGVSLSRWLRAEPRTVRSILQAFVHAGRGLGAPHAAGLVHDDFEPASVVCGARGRVRVTDFAFARPTVVPDPATVAPERHRGEPADARSDQFSFSVALHEALFKSPRARVPSHVRRALERGMSANPTLRHPSMEALLDELTADRRPVALGVIVSILVMLAIAAAIVLGVRQE